VHIADGAYVAAGSTITSDVGAGELAVSRGQQRNIRGWVARKRAGTASAAAAEAALARAAEEQGAEAAAGEEAGE
jgi:bifunctional UDP-N-acetylglucosamine pyrophosphorylase/glucosamine-1-phosphate N-acetyltransferase